MGSRPAGCAPGLPGWGDATSGFGEQIGAEADTLAADIHAGTDDHPLHFVLMFAAEAADQILFVFISAGIVYLP